MTPEGNLILLAYAGDFETSVAIPWLAEHHKADVVALTLDVGQGTDLADVRDRALAIGAVRAHVLDVREEFAREFVAPALKLGTTEPRVAALSRPIVARYLTKIAAVEGTTTVTHGSHLPASEPTGLDARIASASSGFRVLAPCRDWGLSPAQVRKYAGDQVVPAPPVGARLSAVRTLWGRALMGEILERPWADVPPGEFTLTRSVTDWSTTPATLDLEFANGIPTSLNGVTMPLVELLSSLETIAGSHGIGRLDFPAVAGVRPRVVEEAPAPVVLHQAMKAIAAVVPALWPMVRGTVRLKCFMGECVVEEVTI